jgi:hypothetical protein
MALPNTKPASVLPQASTRYCSTRRLHMHTPCVSRLMLATLVTEASMSVPGRTGIEPNAHCSEPLAAAAPSSRLLIESLLLPPPPPPPALSEVGEPRGEPAAIIEQPDCSSTISSSWTQSTCSMPIAGPFTDMFQTWSKSNPHRVSWLMLSWRTWGTEAGRSER